MPIDDRHGVIINSLLCVTSGMMVNYEYDMKLLDKRRSRFIDNGSFDVSDKILQLFGRHTV